MRVSTCCEAVSLLTPLRDKHGDLPVASPPKRLHGQRYPSTREEPVKAVTAGRRGREEEEEEGRGEETQE